MRNAVEVAVRAKGSAGYDVELRIAFKPVVVLAHFDRDEGKQAKAYRDGFADSLARVLSGFDA